MTDPHDREPIGQATIDCWRINYGLDKRTPRDAAQWWHDNLDGRAPAGCVAALGVALDEIEAMRADASAAVEAAVSAALERRREYDDALVAAERERCADICDQHASCEGIAEKCAAAIRADEPIIDGWPLWSGLPPAAKP